MAILELFRYGRLPRGFHSPYRRRRIWNLRHWLIAKLACGDMIMLNFDRRCTGNIVPKNLGDALIHNVDIEGMIGERQGLNAGGSDLDLAKRSSMKIGHIGGIALFSHVHIDCRNTGGDFPQERKHRHLNSSWL